MAEFGFDNPTFEPDVDGDMPPIGDLDAFDVGSTSSELPLTSEPATGTLRVLRSAIDNYYDALGKQELPPALGRDPSKFELVEGRLRLKAYPDIDIINAETGKPLSLSTIAGKRGGGRAIREGLGFTDWTRTQRNLSGRAVSALQKADKKLGDIAGAMTSQSDGPTESVELEALGAATEALHTVEVVETTLTSPGDADIDGLLETMDDPPLNLRELRGLNKALQTNRGELTNNLAKLSELDEQIAIEKRKLDEADDGGVDDSTRRRIAERLRNLEDERASRLEAAAANREALRSQVSRIRETISRVLNEDTTLADRIRTIFREQGVTIASILTAVGMAISTLVLALMGGGGSPAPAPTPSPPDKGGSKEWVKKHLQNLGRTLAKLAGKAAAALPGIIGSIVSWLLNLLAKTTGWLAENLWAMILTVGALLFMAARAWLWRVAAE